MRPLTIIVIVLTSMVVLYDTATAATEIVRVVIAAGGRSTTSSSHVITATIGQPFANRAISPGHELRAGFWRGGSLPHGTGVADDSEGSIRRHNALLPPRPNPFNPSTVISFETAQVGHVNVSVYDVRGAIVRRLISEKRSTGRHQIVWNGKDDSGAAVSSGVYFVVLEVQGFDATRKLTLLK